MNRYPIREAVPSDVEALFDIRARTRENAIPRAYLESIGITASAWAESLASGTEKTWVCLDGETPVGFCAANAGNGEVVVLAVLPEYEGRGIGRRLLDRAVAWLRSRGWRRLWLATNPDPAVRSHGFYRAQGWRPTGERQRRAGDEILVLTDRDRARALAEKLWRYHHMDHELAPADAILVLCSHDTSVAERGAQLFLEGWAPLLIFSGGLGAITRKMWSEPEAELFARIARGMGVPEESILVENESTNTGENVLFTRRMLAERGLDPHRFIVVQKPYMERRSYATFRKVWPEKEVIVTSPRVSFAEYLEKYSNPELSADDVVSIMVGDLQRIRLYPALGFQIHQEIPDDVWAAYEELVGMGYDRHLVGP